MNKSQLFKTAWTIAREGQQKFGGNVKEYFAESLKLAYKLQGGITMEFKKHVEYTERVESNVITLFTSNRQPAWIATIEGPDERFGLKRRFVSEDEYKEDGGRWFDVELTEGKIYNWSEERKVQHFGIFENGKLYEIAKADAEELVK